MRRLILGLVLLVATEAHAQSLGARGFITYGRTSTAASDTFTAVAGKTQVNGIGFGGTIIGIWKGLFVDAAFSQQKYSGHRVFRDSAGRIYDLGIPLVVKFQPIDIAAGWRLNRRVSPYAGGGLTFMSYKESSDFAESSEDLAERTSGALVLAGIDVALIRFLHVGGEVRYRSVTGILGTGGISQAFGEDQIGGLGASLRVSVGN
jgi:hypothetical protein